MNFKRLADALSGGADALAIILGAAGLNSSDSRTVTAILEGIRKAAGGIANEKPVVVKKSDVTAVVKAELPAALTVALQDPATLAALRAALVPQTGGGK